MTARPPRRDHYLKPATDEYSQHTLDDAVATLATLRGMAWLGDTAVTLHILTSLHAEIEQRLPRAVADARDQDHSWAEIADLLGVTRASAWQRYAGRTNDNRTPLDPD
jgi:hypothetical protein